MSNAEIYFIGGHSLSGKSEVAKYFLQEAMPQSPMPIQYIGTDAVRSQIWDNIGPHPDDEPAAFQIHTDRATETEAEWMTRSRTHPEYAVDRQHAEAEVIQRRGFLPILRTNMGRNLPTLFEGVHALPQHLATLPYDHRAVFIGNNAEAPSSEYIANVMQSARELPSHYMKDWSEQKIITYLSYIVPAYANRLRELAEKYDYPYFDLSKGNPSEIRAEAARTLFGMSAITAADSENSPG